MRHVLLADENSALRSELGAILEKQGHYVLEVGTAIEAQTAIQEGAVDLIVADFEIRSGQTDLLDWTRANAPQIPFVLMATFANLGGIFDSYARGARDFLTKPFLAEDAVMIVSRILRPDQPELSLGRPALDEYFARVSLDDLHRREGLEVDVYIRLSQAKYVKVGRQGAAIPRERTDRYRHKGVDSLFVRRSDIEYDAAKLTRAL